MKSETENVQTGKTKKDKTKKGCYWNWLEEAEIKTFEAWNKERKN